MPWFFENLKSKQQILEPGTNKHKYTISIYAKASYPSSFHHHNIDVLLKYQKYVTSILDI